MLLQIIELHALGGELNVFIVIRGERGKKEGAIKLAQQPVRKCNVLSPGLGFGGVKVSGLDSFFLQASRIRNPSQQRSASPRGEVIEFSLGLWRISVCPAWSLKLERANRFVRETPTEQCSRMAFLPRFEPNVYCF